MADFVKSIYRSPMISIIIIMILIVFLWSLVGYISINDTKKTRTWQMVNRISAMVMLAVVFYITVLNRQSVEREVILIPFHFFCEAEKVPEIYRTMLMNVFLFEPMGLALPFALPDRVCKKILTTISIGFGLSVAIEIMQYIFSLGRVEVDDVICNTLGCAIGTGAYIICKRRRVTNKRMHE